MAKLLAVAGALAVRQGCVVELSGPRLTKTDSNSARVEGKYYSPGGAAVSGTVRVELLGDGSVIDTTSVQMTIEAGGEETYSVELAPGAARHTARAGPVRAIHPKRGAARVLTAPPR